MPSAILVTAPGTMTLHVTPCSAPSSATTFDRPDHARLGGRVVGHPVVAVQPADRRRQHDAAVPGLAHQREGRPDDVERAAQMDVEYRVEVLVRSSPQAVAWRTLPALWIKYVDPAVAIDRRRDDGLAAGRGRDRLRPGDRVSPGRDDLVDHLAGRGLRRSPSPLRLPRCR